MCTVSYIPTAEGFFLTSNRDEKKTRSSAIAPSVYGNDKLKVLYPKDPDGNGSWIAINTIGLACVLLNGAFVKHESIPPYRKSRGLVLMEVINKCNSKEELVNLELDGIEPFTLIICDKQSLTELRWDGLLKHLSSFDSKKAKIWSSVTLYDQESSLKRIEWFERWQQQKPFPLADDIIGFHHFAGEDFFEGLIINREKVKTVSVTCVSLKGEEISMIYNDLENEKKHELAAVLY